MLLSRMMVRGAVICICCCLAACSDDAKKKIGDPCENNVDCVACAVKTSGSLWCWGSGVNKATQQLDNGAPAQPIDDAVLLTSGSSSPYRIVKTNGEYWKDKYWKQVYSCP